MQYLTEVRKTKAFVGEKAELKLLAKNTSENNWIAINVEQIVPVPDSNLAKDLKDGQLAIADLVGTNNDIKSLQDASRRLVQILQNFGKLQEKFKAGEQEIEQWKQSLTFQTQEVQRREIEVEERERELEQLQARKEEIESQLEKFDREREEVLRLREEIRAKEQEFAQRATALSAEQAQELRDLVRQLSSTNFSFPAIEEKINTCLETIYKRQEVLNEFWRELEGQRERVTQAQQEVEAAKRHLDSFLVEWKQVQNLLIETQVELKLRKEQLQPKENIAQILRTAHQAQMELFQNSSEAIVLLSGSAGLLSAEEVKRLQEIPIEELEEIITASQAELEKALNFVNLQEDELAAIEGDIAEISNKIALANEFEKLELEAEKESLEEEYRAQENSLQGQRRGLQERESILEQQRRILEKRMGSDTVDPLELLRPIVLELETMQQQTDDSLASLQKQIESDRAVIKQQENLVGEQKQLQQKKQLELKQAEEQLAEKIRLHAEAQGKLNSLERILRPVQDIIDAVRPMLEQVKGELAQGTTAQGNPEVLKQLEQKINALIDDDAPKW
ncbi:MAG: pilus motility taxis protein HmpF [Cyanobacteria bacterium KgW148]|nr:pilus motility taxis protein HmpF [Cyanobacteria bacterium KgW148]